ncbi:MAG: glutaminyl-peptide cyclotransferase [bacterium]|nr:glutaminyl-peptide cyclotransferase [bacterium]
MKRLYQTLVLSFFLALVALAPAAAQDSEQSLTLLVPEVISVRPHDTGSYTQGLLWHEGVFYESAGEYGESDMREVDPETGDVLRIYELGEAFFAEGLALVDDRLIQLTWVNGVAFVYDRETFEYRRAFRYEGEGWGLCYDGEVLYMSDGSEIIDVRDPQTFELLDEITVTYNGQPVSEFSVQNVPLDDLNELECVGGDIYANVWQSDVIVRIDKQTGAINAVVDATRLLTPEERAELTYSAVLNGIAYNPDEDVFYITGKLWPKLFEVRFVTPE